MKNRTLRYRTLATTLLLLAGAAPSCATPAPPGETMMILETDMSLPKDVDAVKIEVLVRGDVRHKAVFEKLGAEQSVKIPASLGIIIGETSDPTTPVTVRVTATQQGIARVLNEAVTTVPEDRIAALRMPIQWLCWNQVKVDDNGDVQTDCPKGETCVAGSCVSNKIDVSKLATFREEDVFGGGSGNGDGSCFDVGACFTTSTDAPVDLAACSIAASGEVNVGIRVESAGICGPGGCFVVLDGKSDLGWQPGGGDTIKLPKAVCDRIESGKAAGVSVSAVSASCALKTNALPTCGPWSSAGTSTPPGVSTPVALVANQDHPVSLAVADGNVYWINSGTSDKTSGALKRMPITGGTTTLLQSMQAFPKALTLDVSAAGTVAAIYWATNGVGGTAGNVFGLDVSKASPAPISFTIPGLVSPEGIATQGGDLFFTDFGGNAVVSVNLTSKTPTTIAGPANGSPQLAAYRVAADSKTIFWTNESSAGQVMMANRMDPQPVSIADMQGTPRELALDLQSGVAAAVYWTNYSSGEVMTASITGTPALAGTPTKVVDMQTKPYGVVVDGATLYWTNGDGTVMKAPKAGGIPVVVASGQASPGAITVDSDNVYWINQGSLTKADGAIMKLKK